MTHKECFGILQHLSAPQGPQVVPGQAPRPAKVLCLAFFRIVITCETYVNITEILLFDKVCDILSGDHRANFSVNVLP